MHLPAFSHGVTSFLWGLAFGVFIWIGGIGVGFSGATSFVVGCVAAAGIFLYIRVYGEDEPPAPIRRRSDSYGHGDDEPTSP